MRRWQITSMALLAASALAACNSAGEALQPSTAAPQSTQSVPGPSGTEGQAAAATAPASSTPAQAAAILAKTRLQIAPLVGVSVAAATPLTERLTVKVRERGIALVGSADTSATHILKGYFSVLTEGKETTVIYVWDLYDPSGNRLHRINGQEKAPSASGAEGWAAVPPATMQAVADATVDQLATWLTGKTG